eukprot:TRINITY_DN15601_c0_g1_i2.p1 TRINITY_DN15601_c0_g1~~TRINITY_DN15601_c0_g1_i2.p1  ORF type:complete len:550 (+),score=127.88 TRINITY_DN15601_c0_g1_i2:65-1714(+)
MCTVQDIMTMANDHSPAWSGRPQLPHQRPSGALTRADVREEVGKALATFAEDVLRQELDRLQADLKSLLRPLQRQDLSAALDEWWSRAERTADKKGFSCCKDEEPLTTSSLDTGTTSATALGSPPASPLSLPEAAPDSVKVEVATPVLSAFSSPTMPSSPLLGHFEPSRKDWRRSFVENATKANRKIQYVHGSKCSENDEVNTVLEEAIKALEDGVKPHLVEDGLGGTYFVKDRNEAFVAVFKPRDEEPLAPNNPKVHACDQSNGRWGQAQKGLKEGVLVGEAAINEYAAFLVDQASLPSLRAGVCPTALVRVANSAFHSASEDRRSAFRSVKDKVGSFQLFAKHDCTSEDMGPGRFPDEHVHRIAALDIRLCNTDRHSGNILVRKAASSSEVEALVPIDHGYALPGLDSLGEVTFEWLSWPAAKRPFSQAMREEIRAIDVDEVESTLLKRVPMLRCQCLATLRTCTALLQQGVEAGLTAHDIGSLMARPEGGEEQPSVLEELVAESRRRVASEEDSEVPEPSPEERMSLLKDLIAAKCKALAAEKASA